MILFRPKHILFLFWLKARTIVRLWIGGRSAVFAGHFGRSDQSFVNICCRNVNELHSILANIRKVVAITSC
jgi:hypothetical protein